jgi:hypothetical protein
VLRGSCKAQGGGRVFGRWVRGALGVSSRTLPRAESLTRSRRRSSSPHGPRQNNAPWTRDSSKASGNGLLHKLNNHDLLQEYIAGTFAPALPAYVWVSMVAVAVPGPRCPCIFLRRAIRSFCACSSYHFKSTSETNSLTSCACMYRRVIISCLIYARHASIHTLF